MNFNFFKKLLVFVFGLCYSICVAQDIDNKKAQEGDMFLYKGVNYFIDNEADSALIYIKKAAKTYKDAASWTKYVSALNDITHIY